MPRARLLVVGTGGRVFREYGLAAMSQRADLLILSGSEPGWELPYAREHRQLNLLDSDALLDAAQSLRPDGVLTYDERLVEAVAELAAKIGLPGPAPEAVHACKDKAELRRRLAAVGSGPVGYALVTEAESALRAAAQIGYPVVVKPRALGGSVGVLRVDAEADLPAAFEIAATADADGVRSMYDGVLIEEYLEGPELSVDCAVWDGVAHPAVVAEKEVGFEPYFEELGHLVPAASQPGLGEAVDAVVEAHRVVRLDRLVTHSEVKLTPRGPRLVEINARLGGDLIPLLGRLATGVDLTAAAADIAVGRAPDLRPSRSGAAAIRMIYPSRDQRVDGVALRQSAASYPGLDRFEVVVAPGSDVRLPPRHFLSRIAFAVVAADRRDECAERLAAVASDVVVHGEPLVAG